MNNPPYILTLRAMQATVAELHRLADALVNELEDSPLIGDESSAGDNARAALDGARAWRARVESGA